MKIDSSGVSDRSFVPHSSLSHIARRREIWKKIPYLSQNEGRAPPLVLAVGDRRRVHAIAGRLRNPVLLPERAGILAHPAAPHRTLPSVPEFGRVAMAIGLASSSTPVLVVETQMGAPATQIIMKEILSDDVTITEYHIGKAKISLPHRIVVRVGTAGGINCPENAAINVGDVVNATHSIGVNGAVIQALLRLDFWQPSAMHEFRTKWTGLGPEFTITEDGDPRVECNKDVVEALDIVGQRVAKARYHKGGNVTKDSLYAELSEDVFVDLCRKQNCRSTEMELSAIAVASNECKAHFGMITGIVGVLPGGSFTESEAAKAIAERTSIRIALKALDRLVQES